MLNYIIEELAKQPKGPKVLQLEVIIKDNRFHIYYNPTLLLKLGIEEDAFITLADNLIDILDPAEIDGEKDLVSLYVVNIEVKAKDSETVSVDQELKTWSNNKDFDSSICKKVSYAVLEDVFKKMGVSEESIKKHLS